MYYIEIYSHLSSYLLHFSYVFFSLFLSLVIFSHFASAYFNALHFELTNKCNLRCKHCYNIDYLTSDASELSFDEIKKIIDIAKSLGCNDIGLSGGEPFMHKDIMKIIDYVSEYPIHILTNGLLINQSIIVHIPLQR